MTYKNAVILIGLQERNLQKVKDIRITYDGYEYRIDYHGGFAEYVAIDRRKIGTRNFKYFGGFGAYTCFTVGQVLDIAKEKIGIPA